MSQHATAQSNTFTGERIVGLVSTSTVTKFIRVPAKCAIGRIWNFWPTNQQCKGQLPGRDALGHSFVERRQPPKRAIRLAAFPKSRFRRCQCHRTHLPPLMLLLPSAIVRHSFYQFLYRVEELIKAAKGNLN